MSLKATIDVLMQMAEGNEYRSKARQMRTTRDYFCL
jgi:hypothetical protein